jgi:ubiquinone/menaquinone biosynthesis C-methylase UbiE
VPLKSTSRSTRQDRVVAQYDSALAANEFADAYHLDRPEGRFFRARLRLVQDILAPCPGGDLLDAGCGPGMITRSLLESRPLDFRITVIDQSPAMVEYCTASARSLGAVSPAVGRLEALPYADAMFDITLAMGVLEYTDARAAIGELHRVTRPGGLVVVTMLNPLSLYRIVEWFVYWPLVRLVEVAEKLFSIPADRRHKARFTGIHALPSGKLRRIMTAAGLQPVDLIYYNITMLIPPLDRLPLLRRKPEQVSSTYSTSTGWRRWMGTGYLLTARRPPHR